MAEASVPVDLLNPGQVFACLGLLEAAGTVLGGAEGGFDWSDPTAVRFRLGAAGDADPVRAVLRFLARAEVSSEAPERSPNGTEKWHVPTRRLGAEDPFPYPDPQSPATLPALLTDGENALRIDHWGDATRRDNVKFWAGAAGYPGVGLLRDALDLVRDRLADAAADPFALSAPQSSSFRFDWRRDYIPMEVGFSPNMHADTVMLGFPLVEILAAIGLADARPQRVTKLEYLYGVIAPAADGALLSPILLRAALGCAPLPFPQRRFRMRLGWPGQENQARCITDVTEEAPT